jgi:hypothetical protein
MIQHVKKEELLPRYKFVSLPYYQEDHEEFEQKAPNFEPLIRYVVEQEATIPGIRCLEELGQYL